MHLLGEAGEERYFSNFAFLHLDDVFNDAGELSMLSQLAKSYGYMRLPAISTSLLSMLSHVRKVNLSSTSLAVPKLTA